MDLSGLIGRTGEPFEMVVEFGKVREFARATGSSHPAYVGSEDPVMPVTFLQTYVFWAGPESSPWPAGLAGFERRLHGSQEFVFHGTPPDAGTRLRGVQRIAAVYTKEGRRGGQMTFAEVVTDYRDEHGDVVAESRSTLIWTGQANDEG